MERAYNGQCELDTGMNQLSDKLFNTMILRIQRLVAIGATDEAIDLYRAVSVLGGKDNKRLDLLHKLANDIQLAIMKV